MFVKLNNDLSPQSPDLLTFRALGEKLQNEAFKESHLEEFVRKNIDLFVDDESLLIIGQQVVNSANARNDMVGVDGDGNLVLIELKRDAMDMLHRREAMEFQAIRYVASLAKIHTIDEAVALLFGPYIRKHKASLPFSSQLKELTEEELARRLLNHFLEENSAMSSFNRKQRIVLIAAAFDEQTKSACAWLSKNQVDIRCIEVQPYQVGGDYFLEINRLIPPTDLDEFFLEISENGSSTQKVSGKKAPREFLPRMPKLFEWNLLSVGDELLIRNFPGSEAAVKDENEVVFKGSTMSYNEWGQHATGWSSINIYEWAILKKANKTLDGLRREKMG